MKQPITPAVPVTMTIDGFCAWSGNGRSKVYEMIKDGLIETVRPTGSRQLVLTASYLALIERQRAAQIAANTTT